MRAIKELVLACAIVWLVVQLIGCNIYVSQATAYKAITGHAMQDGGQ